MRRFHASVSSILLFAALAAAPAIACDSVDVLLERHIEARGGQDAWAAIDTLKLTGTFTAFSEVSPFTLYQGDGHYRLERSENGPVTTAYDGEVAWEVNPFVGNWPTKLGGLNLAVLSQDLDFPNPFFHHEERGYALKWVGEGEVDGIAALVVELTRPNGDVETWYFDPDTHLELARDSKGSDFGRPSNQRTFFDDFRSVGDVKIPHYVEKQWYTRNRIFEVETAEVLTEVDDALFAVPRAVGMETLGHLEGTWTVAEESRQSPQAPFTSSTRETTLSGMVRGGLIQEHFTTAEGNEVVRQWSYDQFRKVYRLLQINDATTHVDIQEGTFEDDALVVSNLETGTTVEMEAMGMTLYERTRVHGITEEGFTVETENSIDGGENWFVSAKAVYTRPGS